MHNKLSILLGAILFFGVSVAMTDAGTLLPEDFKIADTYKHGIGKSVGRILLVQGDVIIIHQGESVGYRAQKGSPVYKMDSLVSLKKGRCLIRMNDQSRLTLASSTRLTINRAVFREDRRERSSYFKMAVGKARFWVTKISESKRAEFSVKAATAVVGVRGSDFQVENVINEAQIGAEAQTVVTAITPETIVDVTSTVNPELSIRLEGLQQVTFFEHADPSDVADISPDDAADIMNEMPVNTEDFKQLSLPVTEVGKKTSSEGGQGKGGDGEKSEGTGEGEQDEGAGEGEQDEGAGETDQEESSGEGEKETQASPPEDAADEQGGEQAAVAGSDSSTESDSGIAEGGDLAGPETGVPSETEPAFTDLESEAAAPVILVDDSELIEPEVIVEEVELPAPVEPIIEDVFEQEEQVSETNTTIAQEIYEETVAGELPDFPSLPE